MLIAAIVGLDTRSTMDLDTTLRNLPLTEEKITEAIDTICKIDMKDDVVFTVKSIEPIRKEVLKATAEHRGSTEQISDGMAD